MITKIAFILSVICFPNGLSTPGGQGGIPGGLSQCHAITSFHVALASYALAEIGSDYVLRRVTGVRTQVVAGSMYHFELHVAKTSLNDHCEHCDVRVWHQLSGEYTLDGHECRIECCH